MYTTGPKFPVIKGASKGINVEAWARLQQFTHPSCHNKCDNCGHNKTTN